MISDYQYNRARNILVQVGSHTAGVSHPKHTQGTDFLNLTDDNFCAKLEMNLDN